MSARSEGQGLIWHAPDPGPDYWSWRCLRCSEPVTYHASWLRRMVRRLSTRPGKGDAR